MGVGDPSQLCYVPNVPMLKLMPMPMLMLIVSDSTFFLSFFFLVLSSLG